MPPEALPVERLRVSDARKACQIRGGRSALDVLHEPDPDARIDVVAPEARVRGRRAAAHELALEGAALHEDLVAALAVLLALRGDPLVGVSGHVEAAEGARALRPGRHGLGLE